MGIGDFGEIEILGRIPFPAVGSTHTFSLSLSTSAGVNSEEEL